jgi:hypothetical protein
MVDLSIFSSFSTNVHVAPKIVLGHRHTLAYVSKEAVLMFCL